MRLERANREFLDAIDIALHDVFLFQPEDEGQESQDMYHSWSTCLRCNEVQQHHDCMYAVEFQKVL
jgi:hypothetical protein